MTRQFLFFIVFALSFGSYSGLQAQTGIISGTIFDQQTGETLIGAIVQVEGTTLSTATDIDGRFHLSLAAGTHSIKASYVSYSTQIINNVVVRAGEIVPLDIKLGTESVTLNEIVVEAKVARNTENALQTLQKKSAVVQDAISSQLISRLGDNDAGSAVKRITGVSVEGGKYVYVRGLGDRYTKITLNGAEIPGLDPSRNTVQLDMFPSSLIDNITILKTFSADLPGDFTGGFVNLSPKEFPDQFMLHASASVGYNTNATFNDQYLGEAGGKTDWIGMDDGTRTIPKIAQGNIPNRGIAGSKPELATQLDAITKAFNRNMAPITTTPFLNQNYVFSVGNRFQVGNRPLGWVLSLSYQNEYEYYDNGITGRYALSGSSAEGLSPLLIASDRRGQHNVLAGAIANLSYKLADKHKLSLNLMRNQSGTSTARYQRGLLPSDFTDDGSQIFESRTLQYSQRAMNYAQLKGEHYFNNLADLKIDWHSAYALSSQNEPDLRFFANDILYNANGSAVYSITQAAYRVPSRFYRGFDENTIDNKLNLTFSAKQWSGLEAKIKTGVSLLLKDRTFSESRYNYESNSGYVYNGNPNDFFSDANIGIIDQNQYGAIFGPVIQNTSEERNNYEAQQTIAAAYISTDLPITKLFKINAGLRAEYTDLSVVSADESLPAGEVNSIDILPAINIIYEVKKDMNARVSYSRTIARPTFRELAPFYSFDFIGDFVLVGNPQLDRAIIDNFDTRWEFFPRPGDMFAVSGFYKRFGNPIETVIEPLAQNTELSFRNVPEARVLGIELEARKKLDFIPLLKNFHLGANLSLINSAVDIAPDELALIRVSDPSAANTRPMFAQSPYLVNAILSYSNDKTGTEANVNFNVFGQRLVVVSAGATPDVYEQARPMFNFTLSQKIGKDDRFKATLRANNILNSAYSSANIYRGELFAYQRQLLGRDFSLGISYTVK